MGNPDSRKSSRVSTKSTRARESIWRRSIAPNGCRGTFSRRRYPPHCPLLIYFPFCASLSFSVRQPALPSVVLFPCFLGNLSARSDSPGSPARSRARSCSRMHSHARYPLLFSSLSCSRLIRPCQSLARKPIAIGAQLRFHWEIQSRW